VGGALESDPYVVPSLTVELTFLDLGWRAVNLGPEMPVAGLVAAVPEYRPRLVCRQDRIRLDVSSCRLGEEVPFGRSAAAASWLRARTMPLLRAAGSVAAERCPR
jgi:hypothetical protein